MILVDSSVWIDYFRGIATPQADRLDTLLGAELLRAHVVAVRKTIDTLIATCCIEEDHALLYSDRDFDPFVEYLGLRSAGLETSAQHAFGGERR